MVGIWAASDKIHIKDTHHVSYDTDLSHLENSSWLHYYFCATIKEMIEESLIPRLDCLKWDFLILW